MPKEVTETVNGTKAEKEQEGTIYERHELPVTDEALNAMLEELGQRMQKLEESGKLQAGRSAYRLRQVERLVKKNREVRGLDQEAWWKQKLSCFYTVIDFFKPFGVDMTGDTRVTQAGFRNLSREGLSFLYAVVEEAENGRDLSTAKNVSDFYENEFQPNYRPNIEIKKQNEELQREFDQFLQDRKKQEEQLKKAREESNKFYARVETISKTERESLQSQTANLKEYQTLHRDVNMLSGFDTDTGYLKTLEDARKKFHVILEQFDQEADVEQTEERKAAGVFLDVYAKERDKEARALLQRMQENQKELMEQLTAERKSQEAVFKEYRTAFEAADVTDLSVENMKRLKTLHDDFARYQKKALDSYKKKEYKTLDFLQETAGQIAALEQRMGAVNSTEKGSEKTGAEVKANYTAFAFIEEQKEWDRAYEARLNNHEKLLSDSMGKRQKLLDEFDKKWNQTVNGLHDFVDGSYDLSKRTHQLLLDECAKRFNEKGDEYLLYDSRDRIVLMDIVNNENLKEILGTHESYKKTLQARRDDIAGQQDQIRRITEERDALMKRLDEPSLVEKYDMNQVKYARSSVFVDKMTDALNRVDRNLEQEMADVDEYSNDARISAEYYAEGKIAEKSYEAWKERERVRQHQEAELERKREERVLQELEDECNRLDEELERERALGHTGYSREDQAQYLKHLIEGLDREQQTDMLAAFGLNQEEREKFLKGDTDFLKLIDQADPEKLRNAAAPVRKEAQPDAAKPVQNINKDLSVALTARQMYLNEVNSHDQEAYSRLLEQYNSVRTGSASEKEKNKLYQELEQEVEKAKLSNSITRGKLNMSDRVCNLLAVGQKVTLPRLVKDNLTVLQEAIKGRTPVAEAEALAAEEDAQIKREQERFEKEVKETSAAMEQLLSDAGEIDQDIADLSKDYEGLHENKLKTGNIREFQAAYSENKDDLKEQQDYLRSQQDRQRENFEKLDVLAEKLRKLAGQTSDQKVKDQLNSLINRQNELKDRINQTKRETADSQQKTFANDLEKLEIKRREVKTQDYISKTKKFSEFTEKWLKDYKAVFKEEDYRKQVEALNKLKASFEEKQKLIPSDKAFAATVKNYQALIREQRYNKKAYDDLTRQYDKLQEDYSYACENRERLKKVVDGLDDLVGNIGYKAVMDDIRKGLNSDLKSLKALADPNAENESTMQMHSSMEQYLKMALDTTNKGNYEYGEIRQLQADCLNKSKAYLSHLNRQLEGTDAREVLRAYQEKGIVLDMFRKMNSLPEFVYTGLEEILETENGKDRTAADREKTEAAIKVLQEQNKSKEEELNKKLADFGQDVQSKKTAIEQAFTVIEAPAGKAEDIENAKKNLETAEQAVSIVLAKHLETQKHLKDSIAVIDSALGGRNEVSKALKQENSAMNADLSADYNKKINHINDLQITRPNYQKFLNQKYGYLKSAKKNIQEFLDLFKKAVNDVETKLNDSQKAMDENVRNAGKAGSQDALQGLTEAIRTFDNQKSFEKDLENSKNKMDETYQHYLGIAQNRRQNDEKDRDDIIKKSDEFKKSLEEEHAIQKEILAKYEAVGLKENELQERTDQLNREAKTRKEIMDAFHAIQDSRDRGIGSHAKFREFKAAMSDYEGTISGGYLKAGISAEDTKRIQDKAYDACLAYLKRHLDDSNGRQSLKNQGSTEGALRKQGVVRILELMKELSEFRTKDEFAKENAPAEAAKPAEDGKAPKKADDQNEKRVRLNFEQLKESLGKNTKVVKNKKAEDAKKNAYADLNAEISKGNNKENNKGNNKGNL